MKCDYKKGDYLDILLRSPKTIFSTKDVALFWSEDREKIIIDRLNKYAKAGKLIRVRRGLYAKDKNYNPHELATRIYTPSYVSFETVLNKEGINFQFYKTIFVASHLNRDLTIDGQPITYQRIKPNILSNTIGIETEEGYSRATKERAFLDRLYLNRNYYFDNLSALDWEKIFEILPIYQNKKFERTVNKYFKYYKNDV